jgi:carotenoid cleavage dioxygenase-like enzyme
MAEQAVIELPVAMPYGLHGSWVGEGKLNFDQDH